MTDTDKHDHLPAKQVVAGSATFAAAALILTSALLTILQGISALGADDLVVVGEGDLDYVYEFNTTVWGWILIVLGAAALAVAFGLFWGKSWARVTAVVMAAFSIVGMFLWLPHYPVWAIIVIALDVIVIWAVSAWHPSA
ncbi:hypothetical protein KIH27_13485 [Mycobacterium sp. M1]|uniref:DUF7144 domain-containing protein n=1 Tax=Mycolicibacter acidiphilus TaxID=2835306 RepID=A0ABS5RJY7_9MYCO|nr:hypothetical protein [Mycolicibacter acidiphilus]MBS9534600.1 hypothetical protein [Mycolicibacter acidiphilus]